MTISYVYDTVKTKEEALEIVHNLKNREHLSDVQYDEIRFKDKTLGFRIIVTEEKVKAVHD